MKAKLALRMKYRLRRYESGTSCRMHRCRAPVQFRLTARGKACILPRVMENQTTNIDLSALDTEAMRSRLSELGSYL